MLPWIYEGRIYVPKNEKGYRDCEYGLESDDVETFSISSEEYEKLQNDGIIARLNEIDGVMIDRFEGDYIPAQKIAKCLAVFRDLNIKEESIFALSLKTGLNYGYGIFTDF